jgi:hypothetical protein
MKDNSLGKKTLYVDIPVGLYNIFAKACVDQGITKTEGVLQYFRWLQRQKADRRKLLHEESDTTFKLGPKYVR